MARRNNGDADFARRLCALMESREVTQPRLVDMTGLSLNSVYGYTHARQQPSLYALKRIREALCCDWDELLGKEEM